MSNQERTYYFDMNNKFKNNEVEREFFSKFIGDEQFYDFFKQLISNNDLKLDFTKSDLDNKILIFEVFDQIKTNELTVAINKENQLIMRYQDINLLFTPDGRAYASFEQDGQTYHLETYRDYILEFDAEKYKTHYSKVTTNGYEENEIPDFSNAHQFIEPNQLENIEFYKHSSLNAIMVHILNAKSNELSNNISK